MFLWYGFIGVAVIMLFSIVRRTDHLADLYVGTFIVVFLALLIPIGSMEGFLRPLTWDSRLRAWDLALGLDGFALARFCFRHSWAPAILIRSYDCLPLVFALNWSLERSKVFLKAAALGGICAFPFYMLVPACGPVHAFPGYPWHAVVPSGLIAIPELYPRNCFPSLHFAWALLLAWNARNPMWKTLLVFYAALIGFATVGGGEHYFVDLIAAVPFSAGVQMLARRIEIPRRILSPVRDAATAD